MSGFFFLLKKVKFNNLLLLNIKILPPHKLRDKQISYSEGEMFPSSQVPGRWKKLLSLFTPRHPCDRQSCQQDTSQYRFQNQQLLTGSKTQIPNLENALQRCGLARDPGALQLTGYSTSPSHPQGPSCSSFLFRNISPQMPSFFFFFIHGEIPGKPYASPSPALAAECR